jgi:hypothetical protein
MHDVYFANSKDIYGAGFKIARIPLRPRGEKRSPTWYARHGDWFGWSCVGLMAAMLITRAKRKS